MGLPTLGHRRYDAAGDDATHWSLVVTGDTVVEESSPPDVGARLEDTIADAALGVTNLEAPVPPADASPIHKIGPTNETAPETPQYLSALGFDAVTLANNHTMDYGPAGLEHTVAACHEAGLGTCGVSDSAATEASALRETIDGQAVTVLNLCEREFGAATEQTAGTAWVGRPGIEQEVAERAASSDVLVVLVHGGIEYVPLPPPQLQARLRALADAGADLVVGHHPHVAQGWEHHGGTPIVYSLGNFRYTRCCRPKTEWGLVCAATFAGDTLERVELHPVERREDAVGFMGDRWSPEQFRPYFETVSEVVADRERLRAHWQEQAVRVFEQRYAAWLRRAAGSDPLSALRHPLHFLGLSGLWDGDAREHEQLLLLNLVRNESHRAVIETTMALRGDRREDRRTPPVEDRVRKLFETTEDKPVYGSDSTLAALRSLSARLSIRAQQLPDRLLGRQTGRDA